MTAAVKTAVQSLSARRGACDVALTSAYAAATYAMLNVTLGSCLQEYSDAIVNATYALAEPNQTVPSWVNSLPEPERSEKLALLAKYGSPNVFSQFQVRLRVRGAWAGKVGCGARGRQFVVLVWRQAGCVSCSGIALQDWVGGIARGSAPCRWICMKLATASIFFCLLCVPHGGCCGPA